MTTIKNTIETGNTQIYRSVIEFVNSTAVIVFGGAIPRGRHIITFRLGSLLSVNPAVYSAGDEVGVIELLDIERNGVQSTQVVRRQGFQINNLGQLTDAVNLPVFLNSQNYPTEGFTLTRKSTVSGSNPGCFLLSNFRGDAYSPSNATFTITLQSSFTSGCSHNQGYDLIIVIGGENASGYGAGINALLDPTHQQVMQWGRLTTDGATYPATLNNLVIRGSDPLHHKSNDTSGNNTTDPGSNQTTFGQILNRIGFSMEFAREFTESIGSNRKLLIIPCAVGGSGFSVTEPGAGSGTKCGNWLYPTGSLVTDVVTRANLAMSTLMTSGAQNRILAFLWLGGEADSSMSQGDFEDAMVDLAAGLRADITGASSAPFLLGQMPLSYDGNNIASALINLPTLIPQPCATIRNRLTTNIPESVNYFSAVSQRLLGQRYRQTYQYLINAEPLTLFLDIINVIVGELDLSWGYTQSILNGQLFTVDYKLSSDSGWTNIFTDATDLTYLLTGLTPGDSYDIRVQSEGYIVSETVVSTSTPIPLTISGCIQWLDGSDPDGNGIEPSDGTLVSTWVDKSGTGNDGTSSGGDRATFNVSLRNSLGGMTFSNGNNYDFTITGFPLGGSARTVFLVYRSDNSGESVLWAYGLTGSFGVAYSLYTQYNGGDNFAVNNYGGAIYGPAQTQGTFGYSSANYNGDGFYSGVTIYVGGSAVSTTTINPSLGFNTSNNNGKLGKDVPNIGGLTFAGVVLEVIAYDSSLSGGDMTAIHTYLASKWAL
jgi:hypothetical protein